MECAIDFINSDFFFFNYYFDQKTTLHKDFDLSISVCLLY